MPLGRSGGHNTAFRLLRPPWRKKPRFASCSAHSGTVAPRPIIRSFKRDCMPECSSLSSAFEEQFSKRLSCKLISDFLLEGLHATVTAQVEYGRRYRIAWEAKDDNIPDLQFSLHSQISKTFIISCFEEQHSSYRRA